VVYRRTLTWGIVVATLAALVVPVADATLASADVQTPPAATAMRADRTVEAVRATACPDAVTGTVTGTAPSRTSAQGVAGTSTADLTDFALAYNKVRVENCLKPVPLANFRYDACMETRLFWIAEDPSVDPASAWGHIGTMRSDGVPSVGCDGNLAGGMNNTGTSFAVKWWLSVPHRTALYRPAYAGSTANVCIFVAVTHGGVPREPAAFARAAARWTDC
jgi:hypothetical protein